MTIDKPITVTLTSQEVSMVIVALGELPAKHTRDLLNRLEREIEKNNAPAELRSVEAA